MIEDDDKIITLAEAAATMFPAASGVTASTLKRQARQGRLAVYRPGKAYLTTVRDVRAMIEASAVKYEKQQPTPHFQRERQLPVGMTEMELADYSLTRLLDEQGQQRKEKREKDRAALKAKQEARKAENRRATASKHKR